MEIDIQYFISKLSTIDGFGKVGDNLTAKVKSKKPELEPEKKEEAKPEEVDMAETNEKKEAETTEASTEAAGSGEASDTKQN